MAATDKVIKFYNKGEPYYEFSNFYPCMVYLDGKTWPTAEHYFQAQKFSQPNNPRCAEYMEFIRAADTPNKAFRLARQKKGGGYESKWCVNRDGPTLNETIELYRDVAIRADWDAIKLDVMRRALKAKFTQNSVLRELLLSTGTALLVENSPRDDFWGATTPQGQNWLGRLLMELRATIGTAP